MANDYEIPFYDTQDRIDTFDKHMNKIVSLEFRDWLVDNGFFTQAASTKFHGAYEGGLFDHSLKVMSNLKLLTGRLDLEWERPESPYIIGMFHDLCKIDQYYKDGDAFKWRKTDIPGHGDKSVLLLSRYMKLTREEVYCIRFHMGAFTDQKEWSSFTDAIHEFPNVHWTHCADMMASHIEMT
ncbi:MAG: hypothetical protein IKH75_00935 [Ruminococcus sp.]|nr:hypothetical protein [Ruminococcus sp.]